jgi:hypothetical protein
MTLGATTVQNLKFGNVLMINMCAIPECLVSTWISRRQFIHKDNIEL